MYLRVMADLGVEVGLAKSLVSTIGYGEFAKKFFNSTDIVFGLSLKEFYFFRMVCLSPGWDGRFS